MTGDNFLQYIQTKLLSSRLKIKCLVQYWISFYPTVLNYEVTTIFIFSHFCGPVLWINHEVLYKNQYLIYKWMKVKKSGQILKMCNKWRKNSFTKLYAGFQMMSGEIGLRLAARNITSAWANCGKQPTIEAILNSVADLLYVAKTIKLGLGWS